MLWAVYVALIRNLASFLRWLQALQWSFSLNLIARRLFHTDRKIKNSGKVFMRQSRRGGLGQGRSRSQRPAHSRSMANSVRARRGGVYKGNNAANQMRQANKVTKFRNFPSSPVLPLTRFPIFPLDKFSEFSLFSFWNILFHGITSAREGTSIFIQWK